MTTVFWLLLSFLAAGGGISRGSSECPNWECVQRIVASEVGHGLYRVQVYGEKPGEVVHGDTVITPPLADYWFQ